MAFSFRVGTNWCHDFPKLARESGFYFNMHGSRVRVDWNRISTLDIDRVIRERDFSIIDENINNVIDYCLESEYDVKILDPNFVKLFRLAQLSVEYLLYCKQYLDHSVIILKDELRLKIEQNVNMKKEISSLEDNIKNIKEKFKEKSKFIETRIGDSSGEIYKCPQCPKTFVSAMFLNAHVARRHSYISDIRISTSPVHEHYRAETEKLHNEIKTLKERLNQTERVIRNESDKLEDKTEKVCVRNMSTNNYDMNKFDWLQEQKKYQEDIGSLKSMLFNEITALREREHNMNGSILETNVKTLINQQEKEIEDLRNQLLDRLTPGIESMQIKLETQENYWKAKIENMESQHHNDIGKLTAELKATQQIADHLKSEYTSKVYDLEKQSMDQSNMLVEQRKQLNSLSREISNSHSQSSNYDSREKSRIGKLYESPITKLKHDDTNYDDNKTYHKSLNRIKNSEIIVEDYNSESSQEYSDGVVSTATQIQYVSNKEDTIKNKHNRKLVTNLNRSTECTTKLKKANQKNLEKLQTFKEKNDKIKHYDIVKEVNEITGRECKTCITKELESIPINVDKMHVDIKNVINVSSTTVSESVSSLSESESDSESITEDDDITIKKNEMPLSKALNIRKSIQEDVQNMFNNRLRELGIDPGWQGIPTVTFKQKMDIVRHQQNINSKKLLQYNKIKGKILKDVLQRISENYNEIECTTLNRKSPLDKMVTHVKSKALKAFNSYKENNEYISDQKVANTTPSISRLKQKLQLLPKKYKEDELENMHESPLKRNEIDVYTSPKVVLKQSELIFDHYKNSSQNSSSGSSIESREDIKQISSTKTFVSNNDICTIESPINRRQMVVPKLSEIDSDSTIIQQEDLVVSPKNNKSVLKSTNSSIGSLIKKKVLFDLENSKDDISLLENDQKKDQLNESDWNISSFPERREHLLQKEKSISTGNITLKTAQSDKIAEISKKIQQQLNIVRKAPIGSVDTIFRSNTNSQDIRNYNVSKQLSNSTSLINVITESAVQSFKSSEKKSDILPQPAPRTLKDQNRIESQNDNKLSVLKYSDLDSDIDEILQLE